MYGSSIASLAASPSSPLRSRAQKLKVAITELFNNDADRLLTWDICAATHEVFVKLQKLSKAVSRHEAHRTEDALLLVMELRFAVATERQEPPILPGYQDVMTLDMNDYSIQNTVTEYLHHFGLGPATFVEMGTTCAQVPIFVDTGGQQTYLNRTTLSLFLPPDTDYTARMPNLHSFEMKIHGLSVPVKLGHGQTLGCNIVGKDWLDQARVVLIADYAKRGCCMHKSKEVRDLMQQLQLPTVVW